MMCAKYSETMSKFKYCGFFFPETANTKYLMYKLTDTFVLMK